MEGKIVLQAKSNKDTSFVIRYPEKGDAFEMTNYLNALSKERTYVSFQGEEISLKEEQEYLETLLKRIEQKKKVYLLMLTEAKIIGIAGIDLGDRTQRHIGSLGISIFKDYRGEGLGKILMEKILEESINNLEELEIITLGLFSKNTLAYNMYKNFGFIEYGLLPNGTKLENGYDDKIFMYKNVI